MNLYKGLVVEYRKNYPVLTENLPDETVLYYIFSNKIQEINDVNREKAISRMFQPAVRRI
jgi:hypothetical protein